MPLAIHSNHQASLAQLHLDQSMVAQQNSLTKLSTGQRINSSADDASGIGISSKLHSTINSQQKIAQNLGNSLSFLQTQAGVLQNAGKILGRMAELKTQSMGVASSATDNQNYNEEFMELQYELRQISGRKFNGVSLFSKSTVQDHALQSIPQIQSQASTTVSLARNFLSGEFVGASGEVIGGRDFETVISVTEPLPVTTSSGSTGVDTAGNKLATGEVDTNWSVTGPTSIERLAESAQPIPWADETATAGWIGKIAGGEGEYLYSMAFDLTDCDLTQVQIQGLAATDNQGSVFINGQDLGFSFPNEYEALQPFTLQTNQSGMLVNGGSTVPNPLVVGTNNVTVQVINGGGPTGLLFDELQISASRIVTTQVPTATITYAGLDQFTLDDFKQFEQSVTNALAVNGSEQGRVVNSIQHLDTTMNNLKSAHSRIHDLDFAEETTKLAKQQILSQASAQMVGNAVRSTDLARKIIGLAE